MRQLVIETVGWYGVGAVLLSYILVTFSVITKETGWFVFLNLTGALSLAVVSYYKDNRQSVVLNLVWAGIAVLGLFSAWW